MMLNRFAMILAITLGLWLVIAIAAKHMGA